MSRWPGIALAAAALLVVTSQRQGAGASNNIVLVLADDQGADAGCYGNSAIRTPALDRLAADGVRFTRAFCTASSCSPSRSVILTGVYGHANGQYGLAHDHHKFSSFDTVQSLPVLLGRAGYRTARIGKLHVTPESAYRFDEELKGNSRNAVEMARNCRDFIGAPDPRPFFLYFCPTDPHRGKGVGKDLPGQPNLFGNDEPHPGVVDTRYDPAQVLVPSFLPDTEACRAELAQYYQSVSRLDSGLGELVALLQELGVYDNTLILYTSDNGIAFPGAKTTVYEPGLRVPLVVRLPSGGLRGAACDAMVSLVDLAPTILEFAGIARDPRSNLQGRSFLGLLRGADASGWDEVFASHTFHEVTMYYPMRMLRQGDLKLIWNIAHPLPFPFASDLWAASAFQDRHRLGPDTLYGRRTLRQYIYRPAFELYDLARDPDELDNLADDPACAPVLERMKRRLRQLQEQTNDPWALKWDRE